MKICSFEDLLTIDEELGSLFLRPDEAVNWIYAMENGIKEWIENHNKQYWEIVRYVSEKRGILGKLRKDKKKVWLKREDFARALLKFCPKAVGKGETVSALKSSMEHYEYMDDLRNLDSLLSGRVVRHHIKEVEDIFDNKPIIVAHEDENKPTLVDMLEQYLRREIDEQTGRFPLSRLCIRPQYDGISPAISVETYMSERFFKEHLPSHIIAYEFVDGVLEKSKLYELMGQYQGKQVKLFIVSSCGLLPDVRALATDRGVGYVRLNPNSRMTSENYILPRSIEDYAKQLYNIEIIEDVKPMTAPLLIMDGTMLTSSLTDVLSENGVAVKSRRLLNIPFLSNDEIEKRANILTEKDVERKMRLLNNPDADLSVDPFEYATQCGLSYSEEEMEETQLGLLIIGNPNRVILKLEALLDPAKAITNINPNHRSWCTLQIGEVMGRTFYDYRRKQSVRKRFTMAHELGHHLLHTALFQEQGVISVGESKETLSVGKDESRWLECQANKFASCLLMPRTLVETLYVIYYKNCFKGAVCPLHYSFRLSETWEAYGAIVGNLAQTLQVSYQAIRIRLQSLGLLIMSD